MVVNSNVCFIGYKFHIYSISFLFVSPTVLCICFCFTLSLLDTDFNDMLKFTGVKKRIALNLLYLSQSN